jgi:hypothetical protein
MTTMLTQTLGKAQLWCQLKCQATLCILPHSRQVVPLDKGKERRGIAPPLSQDCTPRAMLQDVLQKLNGHVTARQSEATQKISASPWTCEGTR